MLGVVLVTRWELPGRVVQSSTRTAFFLGRSYSGILRSKTFPVALHIKDSLFHVSCHQVLAFT